MQTEEIWNALTARPIWLDGSALQAEVTPSELERYYLPLAERILRQAAARSRCLAAIAGPPGSGKSALAALLGAVINLLDDAAPAAVIGLDGWHYPNAVLDSHGLRGVKGAPETYDTAAVERFLSAAAQGAVLPYPVYSRALHDPIPNAGRLETHHCVVLLEGNYWLLDEPPWNSLASWFDLRIFLTAEPAALLDGLRQRHLRGGKSAEHTEAHLQRVDLTNIRRVLAHRLPADVLLTKTDGRTIESVEWGNGG